MKRITISILLLLCLSLESATAQRMGTPVTENSDTANFDASGRGNPDAAHWDIARLDTARNADYLSPIEKDVILEMNKARSDPKKYAERYVRPRLQYYNGNLYQVPGRTAILTQEGKRAVEICIDDLAKTPGVPLLLPEKGLSMAARDHTRDQGKTGAIGHAGSDGSTPVTRAARHGRGSYVGENIAYAPGSGREIVVDLLIDDGVPSRGHRQNILRENYSQAGVSIGAHRHYGAMCVIDYARDYISAPFSE